VLNHPLRDGPGYTGHVSDAAIGLSYMQQRYYDPLLGRFLSVDPVGVSPRNGLNFNRYWYASNNPFKNTDPDGRCDGPSTCAIDRDIAAMNSGDMSREEFMDRSEARAAGAVIGLGIVATGYVGVRALRALPIVAKYLTRQQAKREAIREAKAQATRGIRSLERRIEEHVKKLDEFRNNPTVRPGMEGMSEEAIKAQQAARVTHLEKEIKTFRENIEKLKKVLDQ
jgi:RHS repeat-associated protein